VRIFLLIMEAWNYVALVLVLKRRARRRMALSGTTADAAVEAAGDN
jgi:hypothetical protein